MKMTWRQPFSIFLLVKDFLSVPGIRVMVAENTVQAECQLYETECKEEHERQVPFAEQHNRQCCT